MTNLLAQLAELIHPASEPAATPLPGVAQSLMERAEADAGRNPAEAEALRRAAYAYLSVVR